MSQLNVNYVIDVAILSALITVMVRFASLRFRRDDYMRSRSIKAGSIEHANLLKVSSTPVLGFIATILVAMSLRVGLDVRDLLASQSSDRYGVLVFGILGVLLLYGIIAYVLSTVFGFPRKPDKDRRP